MNLNLAVLGSLLIGFMLVGTTEVAADPEDPAEFLQAPQYIEVDQNPLKDLQFDVCFIRYSRVNKKTGSRVCTPIGKKHCPDLKTCFSEAQKADNLESTGEKDPETPESSEKVKLNGRTWIYKTKPIAHHHRVEKQWGMICSAVMKTEDDPKDVLEETVTCKPVSREVEVAGKKEKKLFCPKIKECNDKDLKLEGIKPTKIGDLSKTDSIFLAVLP